MKAMSKAKKMAKHKYSKETYKCSKCGAQLATKAAHISHMRECYGDFHTMPKMGLFRK